MQMTILLPPDPLATFNNYEGMIEAFRIAKQLRGLSNSHCDELTNLAAGHTDALLGPTGRKNFGPLSFDALTWAFAVRLIMVPDPEREKEMAEYWADRQRECSHVRATSSRVSKMIMERAKPLVLKDFAIAGGLASGAMRTGSDGTEIMRKVAKSRWRKHRKMMRERLRERKLLQQPKAMA